MGLKDCMFLGEEAEKTRKCCLASSMNALINVIANIFY